jgi:hypothetical protein
MRKMRLRCGVVLVGILVSIDSLAFKPSHPKYDVADGTLTQLFEQNCKPKPLEPNKIPCEFLQKFLSADSTYFGKINSPRNFVGTSYSVKDSQRPIQPAVTLEFIALRPNSSEGVSELNLVLKNVNPSHPSERQIIDDAIKEFKTGSFPKVNTAVKFGLTFEPGVGSLEYVRIHKKSLILSRDQRRILFRYLDQKVYALDLPAEDSMVLTRGWTISEFWGP